MNRGRHFRALAALRRLTLVACAPAMLAAALHAEAAPRDIVLMLDNSGSMRKNDPEFLTSVAVRAFLDGLEGDVRAAVVSFDQDVNVLMPLTPLDDATRGTFLASLDAVDYRGQRSNSPAALERTLYELRERGRPGAEKSIVFMTDGIVDLGPEGPDPGDVEKARWMKSTLADEAADSGVRIFGIAFTDNADFELIQTLAKRTGGEYYRAYSAADIDGVFARIRDALERAPGWRATPAPEPATPEAVVAPAPAATDEPPAMRLPEAELPLPDSTAPALPGTDAALPRVRLPEAELPAVTLPEVRVGGDAAPAPNDAAAADAGDHVTASAGARERAASADADEARAPSPPAAIPAPPAVDDPLPTLTLVAAGALLAFALVALVLVLGRRGGSAPAPAADDGLMPAAFLTDIGGITEHKSYELGAKPTIIGRLQGADVAAADHVVIDESTIGRRHALIEYKDHSFWVVDQNSLNGTFVNNSRIEAATRLKHGDRIRFHRHEFEFVVLDMFETDRTMMSETVFADVSAGSGVDVDVDVDDATSLRDDDAQAHEPSPEDPTVTRS